MPDSRQHYHQRDAGTRQRTEPRRWTRESFIPFRLEVLTPVFIGSGEDLSPLEYVIRKEGDAWALHLVDAVSWLQAAQGKSDISAALNKGDMNALRRLMNEDLDASLYSLACMPLAPSLATELLDQITDPNSQGKAEVQPLPRSPVSMAPYVPGSSLKGALSTPLIDSLDRGGKLKGASSYNAALKDLLGEISTHAMQALKVSDVPLMPNSTRIVAAKERALIPDGSRTPKPACEVVTSTPAGRSPFFGRLLMAITNEKKPGITLPGAQGNRSLSRLAEVCNTFYLQRFRDELEKFYRLRHLQSTGAMLDPLLKRIEALDPEKHILLRVGHYSHVECVTVTANRPKAAKGPGTTRTLAGGMLPFGWVILTFCTPAEYEAGSARVEAAILEAMREREAGRAKREEEIRRVVEEQRKRVEAAREEREKAAELERQKRQEQARKIARAEEERQRREREAAEREAMLAGLSPEERLIAEVGSPQGTEAQSMKLWSLLDTLEAGLRADAARALQGCWQRLGKWEGKLTKKQAPKVAKVKQILGA